VNPRDWILRILQETTSGGGFTFAPCANNRFFDNLVYFERRRLRTWVNIGPHTLPQTFAFAHDLWYAWDEPWASQPNLPSPEVGAIVGIDPQLVNPGQGLYTLGPASPARQAGLGPAAVAGDLLGACYRSPPSIGAFEGY
jgi:hypothetical protein